MVLVAIRKRTKNKRSELVFYGLGLTLRDANRFKKESIFRSCSLQAHFQADSLYLGSANSHLKKGSSGSTTKSVKLRSTIEHRFSQAIENAFSSSVGSSVIVTVRYRVSCDMIPMKVLSLLNVSSQPLRKWHENLMILFWLHGTGPPLSGESTGDENYFIELRPQTVTHLKLNEYPSDWILIPSQLRVFLEPSSTLVLTLSMVPSAWNLNKTTQLDGLVCDRLDFRRIKGATTT